MKGPIVLEPYQQKCLREALSKDENGNYKYSLIVWSDIKKSAKSTIAAAVNLYIAEQTEWGENYIIANDLKQADSRVAHYLRRAVGLNPEYRGRYKKSGNRFTAPHGSFIEAIPIDPSGEAGSNADMMTWSELWGAHEDAKEEMWAEMTLSPTKHGRSFRWVESYAGYSEESLLLYGLYERGVENGKLLWPDEKFPTNFYGPQPIQAYVEGRMFCLWNTFARCPWQTKDYYDEEEKTQTDKQMRRLHGNEWVTSEETFVPMEWWDACQRSHEEMPKPEGNQGVIISLDAGISEDNFGLLLAFPHPDIPEDIVFHHVKAWKPPKNGKIDFQGTDENPGPEKELRKLIEQYNVVQVAYDSYQLHDMSTRLYREGLAWFRAFPQGNARLESDSMLRDKIRDRRIWHDGNPSLRKHIANSNAKIDPQEDRKIRIVKRIQRLKIDLAICASMATYECSRLNL